MSSSKPIALIGDYSAEVIAHQAIPKALDLAAATLGVHCSYQWLATDVVSRVSLSDYDGLWCVPASPYQDMEGALEAIRFARESDLPFLGTCGGYQHAALEFARHVLGHASAGNAEVDANTSMPLIDSLVCKLVEKSDRIEFVADSHVAAIYGIDTAEEDYHCSFGVNREYLPLFNGSELRFTGFDQDGDPRVLELKQHRFFIGTAYQPERAALRGENHALVSAFVQAIAR